MTSSFGFKDFEGTNEESAFWNASSEEERQALKKRHVDTGLCLLCMIDELIPQQRPPEPEIAILESEEPIQARKQTIPKKKIAGGLINRIHEPLEAISPKLKVSWAWHNEEQGIVAWTFQNTGSEQASCILFRNSYYFGNAFWPIYLNHPGFGVGFVKKLEPLVDKSIDKNSPPLGIISWRQPDGSYKNIVSFVFTLAAGQTWQMLEGGFSRLMPPQNIAIYEVSSISESDFTIAYDEQQIDAWEEQTDASDEGYTPNPNTFSTLQVLAPPEAPFAHLFEDSIQQGTSQVPKEEEEGRALLEPIPASPEPRYESKLWSAVAKYSGSLDKN
jgi:hypothetical protein